MNTIDIPDEFVTKERILEALRNGGRVGIKAHIAKGKSTAIEGACRELIKNETRYIIFVACTIIHVCDLKQQFSDLGGNPTESYKELMDKGTRWVGEDESDDPERDYSSPIQVTTVHSIAL